VVDKAGYNKLIDPPNIWLLAEPDLSEKEGETRRQGDREKGRRGEGEKGRREEESFSCLRVSLSPFLSFSLSARLPVPASRNIGV
jgi:hypothetical protein